MSYGFVAGNWRGVILVELNLYHDSSLTAIILAPWMASFPSPSSISFDVGLNITAGQIFSHVKISLGPIAYSPGP